MQDRDFLLALYSFLPFGPQRIKLLFSYFGSYEKAWNAKNSKLIEIGMKPSLVDSFLKYRKDFSLGNYFARLKKLSIDFVTIADAGYPQNLIDLEDAPPVLYIKGHLHKEDSIAVAIIGSRKMTSYGREVAYKFSFELAGMGITIVSGLALGIDGVAHKAALDAGGRTIAVLASGLDSVTPASNFYLAKEIVEKSCAILSEYPMGTPAFRTNFASRNRIVSGLSKAVLVVEGETKSGTLLTASHAANQGRQVFAVPGQITSIMSGAPNFLLKNGAFMATSVQDILNELDLQLKVNKEAIEKVMPSDKFESSILEFLAVEPLHLDEISRISGIDVNIISAKLTIMELKGIVKNIGNSIYKVV